MSKDNVILFLTLLAVVAEIGAVVTIACAFTCRLPALRALVDRQQAIGLAFVVALVSMAGSLYFSEVANFRPCRLCWIQRGCMYPLVAILALLWLRPHWRALRLVSAALAGAGLLVAGYHVLVERFPSLESATCDPRNPCSLIWFKRFGYLTIPAMAASGFAAILCLLLLSARPVHEPQEELVDAVQVG
jgi:disulfide bond formation protein DsbB